MIDYIGSGIDVLFIDAAVSASGVSNIVKGEKIGGGKVRLTDSDGNETFWKYDEKGSGVLIEYYPIQRDDVAPAIIPVTAASLVYPNCVIGTPYDERPTINTEPANASNYTIGNYAISGNPFNLTINKSTGEVMGTTSAISSSTVNVTATITNSDNSTVTAVGAVLIETGEAGGNVVESVAITADGSWSPRKDIPVTPRVFHAEPTPADDGTYSYLWGWEDSSAETLGMVYSDVTSANPTISGTPTKTGVYEGNCTVTDSHGNSVKNTWKITVSS
ncbi:hypothetical protein AB6F95_004641 [Salmonella enterica]